MYHLYLQFGFLVYEGSYNTAEEAHAKLGGIVLGKHKSKEGILMVENYIYGQKITDTRYKEDVFVSYIIPSEHRLNFLKIRE